MDKYIGVKEINAVPMTRKEYNDFRGWELPADENGDDEGFLVEYIDGGQANTSVYDGYVSWSPKDVFERAYRNVEGMTFGLAIEAMKKGHKVSRPGWNGKDMFIYHVPANSYKAQTEVSEDYFNGEMVPYCAYIAMKTVDDKVVPWLASQSDMLAEDWIIVE